MSWVYLWAHPDRELIRELMPSLLAGMQDKATSKGWAPRTLASAVYEVDALLNGEDASLRGVVLDDHAILLYDIVEAWWLEGTVLVEYSLMTYKPGEAKVFEAIEELARYHGVNNIVIGSVGADNEQAFSRLLRKHGYKASSPQHLKQLGAL